MIGIFVCFINVAFGTIVISDLRKKIIAVKISDQFTYKLACLLIPEVSGGVEEPEVNLSKSAI